MYSFVKWCSCVACDWYVSLDVLLMLSLTVKSGASCDKVTKIELRLRLTIELQSNDNLWRQILMDIHHLVQKVHVVSHLSVKSEYT